MKIIKIKLSLTVCYLLPVGNQYMLIDTGYSRDSSSFFRQLKKYSISIEKVDYLLLTHYHNDHSGLLAEIKGKNPACKIIMHENAKIRLATGKNDLSKSKYINKRVAALIGFVKLLSGERGDSFPSYKLRENDIIVSGETTLGKIGIDIPGRIVYTPGHTDDSISLILDNGDCFSGDAAANMLSFLGTKHCAIVVEDLKQYYEAWEKLIAYNAETIYPGHGRDFPAEELRGDIRQNHEKNMKKT